MNGLRTEPDKMVQVLNLLCEGMGIRAVSRFTGLHQQTVLNVLARAGSVAGRFLDANIKNVQPESVQADEMFCYVGCKQRRNSTNDKFKGDQYLFLAIDSKSKLIISHVIGKRAPSNTEILLNDLKRRTTGRMQLTTDGYEAYPVAVPRTIGRDIDYAQMVKRYATPRAVSDPDNRYSPPRCIGTRTILCYGSPKNDLISTSYVERTNLTVRLFNRRFTRLTLGYSKKFEYLMHSVNLTVFYYNFVKKHGAHGMTPAQAAGLTEKVFTFKELIDPNA